MTTKFPFGQLAHTPNAAATFTAEEFLACLKRHLAGDWGDVNDRDTKANDRALKSGDERIFSSYKLGERTLWIITEADRSVTTLLLPEDY